jgi:hypothetical protein
MNSFATIECKLRGFSIHVNRTIRCVSTKKLEALLWIHGTEKYYTLRAQTRHNSLCSTHKTHKKSRKTTSSEVMNMSHQTNTNVSIYSHSFLFVTLLHKPTNLRLNVVNLLIFQLFDTLLFLEVPSRIINGRHC